MRSTEIALLTLAVTASAVVSCLVIYAAVAALLTAAGAAF